MIRNNLVVIVIVGLMITLIGIQPAMSKDYVALLICGAAADSLDAPYQILWNNGEGKEKGYDEFWNDTFLLWELLYNHGYTDENIHVLYADGETFPTISRYQADPDTFPGGIVDTSAYYSDVVDIFTDLAQGDTACGIEAMTDDDFFFCWTFGDGGPHNLPADPIVSLCMMDSGVVIWDTTFADYVDSIRCERRVFWMQQCRSGGFKDDLENDKTIFLSACNYNQLAWPADDIAAFDCTTYVEENDIWHVVTCHHGEFNYHVMNAVRGATPKDSLVDADIDGDGFISMEEVMEWEFDHDSGYLCDTPPPPYHVTPQYSDLGNIGSKTFLNATPIVSGHITQNTTWESDKTVFVRGDVIVDAGVTLTIESGTTVKFAADFDVEASGKDTTKSELIVYGTLDAYGTSNDNIVFTSLATSPSKSDWYGIEFMDPASNSSRVENCQIKYAHKGICCHKCSLDVRSTAISNCAYGAYVDTSGTKLYLYYVTCDSCSYGVRVQQGAAKLIFSDFKHNTFGISCNSSARYYPTNSYPDFVGCDVSYNSSSGIILDDSSPIVNGCYISYNDAWGLKCLDDSDPILGCDTLTNNGTSSKSLNMPGPSKSGPPAVHYGGLFCSGTSCPIVCDGPTWGQYERGWNVITDNISDGVYCGGQSSPKLGRGLFSDGQNSIYDNSIYDVYNSTGSTVWAEYNWWGDANGPDTAKIYGSVDWNPYLDEEPSKGKASGGSGRLALLGLLTRPKTREASGTTTKGQDPDSTGTAEEYNELGTYYLLQMMYDEAIEAFQYVLTKFHDCAEANYALVHLMHCYREGGYQADIFPYLQNLSSISLNPELKNLAIYMSVSQLSRDGQYGQALKRCQALLAEGCDEEMEKSLRLREGMLYRYGLDDDETAIAAFQDFITRYSEDPLASIAQVELEILGVSQPPKAAPGAPATKPTVPLPKSFVLHQNYPNPFNAQTCIEYELPRDVRVTLKIYNVLGQQVKTLANDFHHAGHYKVFWDGRNSMGSKIASGIYFIRLEAGTHALTRKTVLLR